MITPDPNKIFPIDGLQSLTQVKPTLTNPNIIVGEYTYFSDVDFERHVTHHYDFVGVHRIPGCKLGCLEGRLWGLNSSYKCNTE